MTRHEARIRSKFLAGLASAALLWVGLAFATPLLHAGGAPVVARLTRSLFSPVCHQIPGRSFRIDGAPMALCARCTGIYAGAALACAALAARLALGRRPSPLLPGRRILLSVAIPTLVEMTGERTGLWPPSATARALSGALLAVPLAPLIAAAARELPGELRAETERLARRIRRTHAGTC